MVAGRLVSGQQVVNADGNPAPKTEVAQQFAEVQDMGGLIRRSQGDGRKRGFTRGTVGGERESTGVSVKTASIGYRHADAGEDESADETCY